MPLVFVSFFFLRGLLWRLELWHKICLTLRKGTWHVFGGFGGFASVVCKKPFQIYLVGGFNPFEKYARQIGNLPQIGVKIKNIWNQHPVIHQIPSTPQLLFWSTSKVNWLVLKPLASCSWLLVMISTAQFKILKDGGTWRIIPGLVSG